MRVKVVLVVAALWVLSFAGDLRAATDSDRHLQETVTPLLKQFCYECHGDGATSGELALDAFKTTDEIRAAKPTFQKIIRYVRGHTMPSPDATTQPTQQQRDALTKGLTRQLYDIDPDRPDPGRVTIRRLNRTEYRNSIRELTGVSFDPTIDFPQDDTGYGFDNIADVLTLPTMLMEKYVATADKVLEQAIPDQLAEQRERRVAAVDARPNFDRNGRV